MAEEIITLIPGYEKGEVHRVIAEDEIGASFLIAKMVSDLRARWNTSVVVLSLDGHKDAIEPLSQPIPLSPKPSSLTRRTRITT